MKRFIFFPLILLTLSVSAQTFPYEKNWKEIEQSADAGNVKSLLPKVNEIYEQAKKDKNAPEIVRTLVFQQQILQQTREDAEAAYKLVIGNFEENLSDFKNLTDLETTTAVLQSLLANLYQQYAQNTQWKRHNITELETPPDDIAEWSTRQLRNKAFGLYRISLENPEILKNAKTANFKQILTSTEDIDLFPTLFDVLSMRFVNFLKNNEIETIVRELNITSKPLENHYITQLSDFHANDKDKSAFLNWKLMEIENDATQILTLAEQYKSEPFSAYLYYKVSEIYRNSGRNGDAFDICKMVNANYSDKWAVNCQSLMQELQTPNLQVHIDETSLPNAPIAVTVSATNCDKVYYRIFSNVQEIGKYGNITNQKGELVKLGKWELRKFNDFSPHSTIVKIDGLSHGNYCIEVSNNQNFTKSTRGTENMNNEMYFSVHNWAMVNLGNNSFQLLSRKTGKPLINKVISFFKYNYQNKNTEQISNKTDDKGIFVVMQSDKGSYGKCFLFNSESKTYIPLNANNYSTDNYGETNIEFDIFTDRAIYRPGQIVYFKGILYSKTKNKAEILKNRKVKIELRDANNQNVAELELTTNDYGSVFGEFVLPANGLTGVYTLHSPLGGDTNFFRVEEYKRPKFEVVMDSLKGEFTLENEVKTSGKAESYAGAKISDAKVVYRVERLEIFPYRYWWLPPVNPVNETIMQDETKTDSEGKFEISFIAKPKKAQKPNEYRTYQYKIVADVTDVNGETHTATQTVTIGDLPKYLILNVPQKTLQKDFTKIGIKSTNLNGVTEHSAGQITVTQLIAPDRVILPNKIAGITPRRYYDNNKSNIDYQIYDYQEFVKFFPHLPYSADETQPYKWKKGKTQTFDFDTEKSENVVLNKKIEKGFYSVEAFTFFGKDTIKTSQIVEILGDNTKKSTDNEFFSANANKTSYQVGEEIKISLVSDLPDATAILNIESNGKWIENQVIQLKKDVPVEKRLIASLQHITDGLFVNACLVAENGFKQFRFPISVKDKPMDLKISTKTFRDKLKPAEPETWELTISGADRDIINPSLVSRAGEGLAEVLATMYDASLDAFAEHQFYFQPFAYSVYGRLYNTVNILGFGDESMTLSPYYKNLKYNIPNFPDLKDMEIGYGRRNMLFGGKIVAGQSYGNIDMLMKSAAKGISTNDVIEEKEDIIAYGIDRVLTGKVEGVSAEYSNTVAFEAPSEASDFDIETSALPLQDVQIRKNLQETAFFYPNLYTDENGDVKLQFTSPEALTEWKLLVLAHTQDLHNGTAEFYAQTQKELMVVPNVPRFLREGDEVTISAKINNLSGKDLENGKVSLILKDYLNGTKDDTYFFTSNYGTKEFSVEKNKNAEVRWTFKVPENMQMIEYAIVANCGKWNEKKGDFDDYFEDGESGVLPVLTNRMLVTETMPIFAKEGQTKTFTMEKLTKNQSNTLQNFNLSLELTTNPLWLAVMSLPYLREYPYECSEQIFSRLYGNILSTHILNQNPKIKQVFDAWNNLLGFENLAGLEANEELKNILLEETPWVRDAQNETEQRKRLALMFDLNKMSQEFSAAQQKLIQRQNADGGFAWFDGGQSSVYITEHIVQGFGQLQNLLGFKNITGLKDLGLKDLIEKSIKYIDAEQVKEIKRQQENIKKYGEKIDGKSFIHYYYVRSFWKEKYPLPAEAKKYLDDINKNIAGYFKNYDLQNKAMIATTLLRYNFRQSAENILNNILETSVESDEMGMYWKDNRAGWHWYQSPVETQTKAIEAFAEIGHKETKAGDINMDIYLKEIEEMKIWLIKNRQTNAWNSTKATTDAVYALMNFGKDWTNAEEGVKVWAGKKLIEDMPYFDEKSDSVLVYSPTIKGAEALAGYIKTSWKGDEITPDKAVIKVEKNSPGTMWGGMYWQYFENLDKITSADSNVKMEKSMFLKKNTDSGQKLMSAETFNVGDLVTVRLVIHIDRDMQYIHIKDMRAAGFEPVNVLSGYKYQNGCAYYESTHDAATNFFFELMTKGTYVFEYDVRANNAGTFSNGITTLQNMYAPEMSCHSEGVRVVITN
ncbi:MAG: hypothetical protein LBH32_08160 [Dysgonamonadaceae bacterium]|jgi:hypothetical protein|nr:hypothetical protein [Dysgonamonadaceae bacterium]